MKALTTLLILLVSTIIWNDHRDSANALSVEPSIIQGAPASSSSSPSPSFQNRRDFINSASTVAASIVSGSAVVGTGPQSSYATTTAAEGSTICVTGANGYIGLHCVQQLLKSGYRVRAALRSTSSEKTKYLNKIAADIGATDKLSFTGIDLFDVNSMVSAGKGCDAMLHLASPFTLKSKDATKSIVEPAIAGATNAVKAAESIGLKRLVATGSIFGVVGSGTEKGFDHVYGSNDVNGFNTINGCAYAYSKMISQQQSIELASDNGVDLVTLNVGQVCGPALSPDQTNPAWEPIQLLANGQTGSSVLSCVVPGMVDVRDVAAAHVAALQLPTNDNNNKPRRYVVASRKESPTYVEIAELLAGILPEKNLPHKVEALPLKVQNLIIKGMGFSGDKSLAELLSGLTVPDGKTLLVDIDPMLKDLVPKPREIKTTLIDWVENQNSYGRIV